MSNYEKKVWVNGVTPVNGQNMNHIEEGIYNAHEKIDELMEPATSTKLGMVKLGSDIVQSVETNAPSSEEGRSFPVQINSEGKMVINVPAATPYVVQEEDIIYSGTSYNGNLNYYISATLGINGISEKLKNIIIEFKRPLEFSKSILNRVFSSNPSLFLEEKLILYPSSHNYYNDITDNSIYNYFTNDSWGYLLYTKTKHYFAFDFSYDHDEEETEYTLRDIEFDYAQETSACTIDGFNLEESDLTELYTTGTLVKNFNTPIDYCDSYVFTIGVFDHYDPETGQPIFEEVGIKTFRATSLTGLWVSFEIPIIIHGLIFSAKVELYNNVAKITRTDQSTQTLKKHVVLQLPNSDIDENGIYYVLQDYESPRDFLPTDISDLDTTAYPPSNPSTYRNVAVVNGNDFTKMTTRTTSSGDLMGDLAIEFNIDCDVTVTANPRQSNMAFMYIDVNGTNVKLVLAGSSESYTRTFVQGDTLCVRGASFSSDQFYYKLAIQPHTEGGVILKSNEVVEYIRNNNAWFKNVDRKVFMQNVSVSNWVADNTYADYGYRAEIANTKITSNSVVSVIYNVTEALSGNYAPVCQTIDGAIYIYSKVNTAITIPTIKEM